MKFIVCKIPPEGEQNHIYPMDYFLILKKRYTVKHNCNFTPNFVAAELPQLLVQPFTCFKSDVLLDSFSPDNNYNDNRFPIVELFPGT